jgi:TatD DNase family protein
MKLIDTHCHIYAEEFDPEQDELMRQAIESGIDILLLPNEDLTSIDRLLAFCDRYPQNAYPMMGLHPESVKADWAEVLSQIEKQFQKHDFCGIGEIGMDLYWDKTYIEEQRKAFEEQLQWSIDLDLPVSIHMRAAFQDVMDCIYKVGPDKLKGVFHCFSGNPVELEELNKLTHFKIGIGGIVTYKNSPLPETLKSCSMDKIVLETDAPYLPPVPYRGRRNEPVYIWKTAEKLSEIKSINIEETVLRTRKNALDLFKNVNNV